MKQNGLSNITAMVIILVILAGVGGYFFFKQSSRSFPSQTDQEQQVMIEQDETQNKDDSSTQHGSTQTTKQTSAEDDIKTTNPPTAVSRLCSNRGEQEFATSEGQKHAFYESASSIKRCDGGNVWVVSEDGAKVTDAAMFYFNDQGVLLDICQALFWRSGCEKFGSISCEEKNYCTE